MPDRQRAIESIEKALEVSAALRHRLVANERAGRNMVKALQRGDPVSMVVGGSGEPASELRRSTTELLADYETVRHHMRTALVLPYLAEGKSVGDFSRELGVSRQLASRLVKQAQETSRRR